MSDQSRKYGDKVSLSKNPFTKKGYHFVSWNSEADGSGKSYDDKSSSTLTSSNDKTITLYVQWSKKY